MKEKFKKLALATIFEIVLVISSFSYLPIVSAIYTVENPYMPPDMMGDFNNNGEIDIFDIRRVAKAYGTAELDDPETPWDETINWDPLVDFKPPYGEIDIMDIRRVTKEYGKVEDPPIAYSTSFEFYVPNDGNEQVHYYILTRVFVPDSLSGQEFYLEETVDDWIQGLKIDNQEIGGTWGSGASISLGNLYEGYHLLEFEFVETVDAGFLNFHVATASGERAWLCRFRVYVPDYSENEYRYEVRTHTYFPGDDFFLGGYANDFIDDVYVDVGVIWRDWMWDLGSSYGAIYAWEDGFMYPLGWQYDWHDITFTFGETWNIGLLDFQYISSTNQQERIGKPKFLGKCEYDTSAHCGWTITDKKAYAGSEWYSDPGTSDRKFSVAHEISAFTHETFSGDHYLTFLFSLGIGWFPMNIDANPDFGITLNLTILDYSGSVGCELYFKSLETMIEVYAPGQLCNIGDIEFSGDPESRSIVTTSFKIATATTIATDVAIVSIYGTMSGALYAAVLGTAAKEVFDYYFDQPLDPYAITYKNDTYCELEVDNYFLEVSTRLHPAYSTTISDVIFLSLNSRAAKHCGVMKIVFSGIIDTDGIHSWRKSEIGKLTTTIYIPMFY